MTTYNHTPIPVGSAAQAALWNQRYEELDEAIGLNNKTGSDPTTSNDNTQGYESGVSKWLNTSTGNIWFCTNDTTGNADWVKIGQITNPADLPSGIDATKIANGTITNTEFQYLNGVTSSIQTQLNSKANYPIAVGDLPTAIDAAKIADGTVSNTEFQHLDGVTSDIQTQLDTKASSNHKDTHKTGGSDAFTSSDLIDAIAKTTVKSQGTTVASRRGINFIPVDSGDVSVSINVTDSGPDEHVNVEISVAGGGVGTDELVKVGSLGTPDYLNENYYTSSPSLHILPVIGARSTTNSQTIYVGNGGDDNTGDGSYGSPYETINHVWDNVLPSIINHDITIKPPVGGANFAGFPTLDNKTGAGRITIDLENDTIYSRQITIRDCTCRVNFINVQYDRWDNFPTIVLRVIRCRHFTMDNWVLSADDVSGIPAFLLADKSHVYITNMSGSIETIQGGDAYDDFIQAEQDAYVDIIGENLTGNVSQYAFKASLFGKIVYKSGTAVTGTLGLTSTASGGAVASG